MDGHSIQLLNYWQHFHRGQPRAEQDFDRATAIADEGVKIRFGHPRVALDAENSHATAALRAIGIGIANTDH